MTNYQHLTQTGDWKAEKHVPVIEVIDPIQKDQVFSFRTEKSGTLTAYSYCNIHGLWGNALEIAVS